MHSRSIHPISFILCGVVAFASQAEDVAFFKTQAPGWFEAPWLAHDTAIYNQAGQAWYPNSMAVADFNGDGRPDVATSNSGNSNLLAPRISVILSEAEKFSPATAYTLAKPPADVAAGDVNGDGFPDIVAPNTGDFADGTDASVLINNGDGTFAPAFPVPLGAAGAASILLLDMDTDGDLDIVTANAGWNAAGHTVSIVTNSGTGTFSSPQVIEAGKAPTAIAAGDFNGDGLPDLVVARGQKGLMQTTQVRVLMNSPRGFSAPVTLGSLTTGGDFSPSLAVADFDNDGDPDIAYSDLKLHKGALGSIFAFAVYTNLGTGSFGTPVTYPLGLWTGGFAEMTVADFNGDGRLDIAGVHDPNGGFSIALAAAGGGFLPSLERIAGESPVDLAASDIDDDGDSDLLMTSQLSMEVMSRFNEGDGQFSPAPSFPVKLWSYHIDQGDVDNDGDLDIAATYGDGANGGISLLRNQGDGTMAPYELLSAPVFASSVKLRDLNGDGWLDMVWADKYPPYSFRTRLNTGAGEFGAVQSWLQTQTCGVTIGTDAIVVSDLDADGDLDVVLVENLACGGGAGPKHLYVHRNDGAGNFTTASVVNTTFGAGGVMVDDVDHDGHLDLIATGNSVEIALGNGNLTFAPVYKQGSAAASAVHGVMSDADGDGYNDIVVTIASINGQIPSLGIMHSYGDGTFAPATIFKGTYSPNFLQHTSLLATDVDADGDMDYLVANYAANDVSIFENNGDGTFKPQVHIGAGQAVRDITLGDFDGDGIADLAASVTRPDNVDVVAIIPGRAPTAGPRADLDGNGLVDGGDLGQLLAAWGTSDGTADLDGNGTVDGADLGILLSSWS